MGGEPVGSGFDGRKPARKPGWHLMGCTAAKNTGGHVIKISEDVNSHMVSHVICLLLACHVIWPVLVSHMIYYIIVDIPSEYNVKSLREPIVGTPGSPHCFYVNFGAGSSH